MKYLTDRIDFRMAVGATGFGSVLGPSSSASQLIPISAVALGKLKCSWQPTTAT